MHILVDTFRQLAREGGGRKISILDVGGLESYWRLFPFEALGGWHFRIVLLNLDFPSPVATVGFPPASVEIGRAIGDACQLGQFANGAFDLAHSNSVIEHVGSWARIRAMADGLRRVGRFFFLQTPSFLFPVEPHFLLPLVHWLPRPLATAMIQHKCGCDLETAIRAHEGIRLLSRRELETLFPDAEFIVERFLGLPKSTIVRSRLPR